LISKFTKCLLAITGIKFNNFVEPRWSSAFGYVVFSTG